MTSHFLDSVIAGRKAALDVRYGTLAPADRERLAACTRPTRDFAAALSQRADVAVIAEVKKASPSLGAIAVECEAGKQALHYQDGGAAAISVLTEPSHFAGSFTDLSDVADAVDIPVLCKDFVVDPVQLFLARGHGADSVLLMVSVLGEEVADYLDMARTLGMEPLVEVHSREELAIALAARPKVLGVNSRDLRTLEVTPEKVADLLEEAQAGGCVVVAESGVCDRDGVRAAAQAGADAVLVGTALMKAEFPEDVLEVLTGVKKRPRT